MREYIRQLIANGDMRIVDREVDPRFELAAVTRASQRQDDRAILFRRVTGAAMPVVTNIYGSRRRLCKLVGADDGNFCRQWAQLMKRLKNDGSGCFVSDAKAERRISGTLKGLPWITYFEKDAGPYITSAIYLARHPETGVANLSFNRSMLIDDRELRVRLGASHDLYKYYKAAEAKGEALPAALLIGTRPEIFVAACASLPTQTDELKAAHLLAGEPIRMRSCETIDLRVPANTEIVVEGRFLPGVLKPEGPFGEFMGYYVPEGHNHVFEISAVTWRPDPVFHSILCGTPEDMYPLDYAIAARIYEYLDSQLPGIINVACYPHLMNTIVQISQKYEGHARHVLLAAIAAHLDYSKSCMVVDEDVDIHDLNDVWWAYVTRGRADTRAFILHDMPGFYRDPNKDHWGRLAIDATKPFGREQEYERKKIPGADRVILSDYADR